MSGIDLTSELTDLRTIINAATGDVATIRDAGRIHWPGEPFSEPEPDGTIDAPVTWLDLEFGRIGAGMETFSNEMGRANMDWGVHVQQGAGADEKARSICDALKAVFQGQDTAAMQFYPWEAYPAGSGPSGGYYRIDYQIPFERREAQ